MSESKQHGWEAARARIASNPFYLLGLSPDATRLEIEREGQKLLAMLELGLSAAQFASTPIGKVRRSSEQVRVALSELRDPKKRLGHELRARLVPELALDPSLDFEAPITDLPSCAWPELMGALGWEGPPK